MLTVTQYIYIITGFLDFFKSFKKKYFIIFLFLSKTFFFFCIVIKNYDFFVERFRKILDSESMVCYNKYV